MHVCSCRFHPGVHRSFVHVAKVGLCSDELRKLDDEVIALRVPGRRLHMVVPVVCEPPRDIVLLVELLERGQMNLDIELGPNQVHSLLQRAASPLFKCR